MSVGDSNSTVAFPAQHQSRQPGFEFEMNPRPVSEDRSQVGSEKLSGKVAIITGGDSGIGRAVAYAYAKEGADIAIAFLDEEQDAKETKKRIETLGTRCILLPGDLRIESQCQQVVANTMQAFGKIDILVNNHAVQFPQQSILDITAQQLENTFQSNLFSFFYMVKAVLPHLPENSSIINTSSVTAYKGDEILLDYSASKGAIVSFTRSLALSLAKMKIRVNSVAPGPIWTPLIPASFTEEKVKNFGADTPLGRAGQPYELAAAYVYLASCDSTYVSGQVLHVNGGAVTAS